jgi:hypothetical protein
MRIDSSGNVGIGQSVPKTILNASASTGAILTLESSDTTLTTNDVIGGINFYANDSSTNGTGAKVNIKAIATSTAGTVTALTFGTSDSASATAVEAMRIDASGNVGIGTSSPTNFLGGKVTEITNSSTTGTITDNQDLIVKSVNRFSAISVIAKNTAGSQLNFGDPDDREVGGFQYDHTNNYLVTRVNGAERMRHRLTAGNLVWTTGAGHWRLKALLQGRLWAYQSWGTSASQVQRKQSSSGVCSFCMGTKGLMLDINNAMKDSATTTSLRSTLLQFYSMADHKQWWNCSKRCNSYFAIYPMNEKKSILKIQALEKVCNTMAVIE